MRPSAQVRMPRPTSTSHSSCGGMVMCRSSVERITASASGWREWISELAAYANTCSGSQSLCRAMILVTTGRPTVSVPVLSNTIASDPAGLFEVGSALDQDAAARAVADRGADRGRGGQAHRAGARDQQHGHRAAHVRR